jgi:hypothetical protein
VVAISLPIAGEMQVLPIDATRNECIDLALVIVLAVRRAEVEILYPVWTTTASGKSSPAIDGTPSYR